MSEPVIICASCDTRLFLCHAIGRYFAGAKVSADDFIPIEASIPQPKDGDEMVCPFCGEPYVLPASKEGEGIVIKLEGGAWWPHPPLSKR